MINAIYTSFFSFFVLCFSRFCILGYARIHTSPLSLSYTHLLSHTRTYASYLIPHLCVCQDISSNIRAYARLSRPPSVRMPAILFHIRTYASLPLPESVSMPIWHYIYMHAYPRLLQDCHFFFTLFWGGGLLCQTNGVPVCHVKAIIRIKFKNFHRRRVCALKKSNAFYATREVTKMTL